MVFKGQISILLLEGKYTIKRQLQMGLLHWKKQPFFVNLSALMVRAWCSVLPCLYLHTATVYWMQTLTLALQKWSHAPWKPPILQSLDLNQVTYRPTCMWTVDGCPSFPLPPPSLFKVNKPCVSLLTTVVHLLFWSHYIWHNREKTYSRRLADTNSR